MIFVTIIFLAMRFVMSVRSAAMMLWAKMLLVMSVMVIDEKTFDDERGDGVRIKRRWS